MGSEVTEKKEQLPSRVSEGGPDGFGSMDASRDLKMPRLAILQSSSDIVTDGRGKIGQIADSISKEVYGDTIDFIPLFLFISFIKFLPGEGMVLRSRDGVTVDVAQGKFESYLGRRVEEVPHDNNPNISAIDWNGKEPPSLHIVYNFLVLTIRDGILDQFPICLALKQTAVPTAKDFITMTRRANEDLYARVYKLKTVTTSNDKGKFAVPVINFERKCTQEEYAFAKEVSHQFRHKAKDIDVHVEDELDK